MARIIISGSSETGRDQISRLLSASGHPVFQVCAGAWELRRVLNDCDDGLLVLAGPVPGCSVDELFWDYGRQVHILLIARPPVLESCEAEGVFRLALPCSQQAVAAAVEMLSQLHRMNLPRRTGADEQAVGAAKAFLMRRDGLTEPQAHRALQQYAMNRGLRMADVALQLLREASKETEE